MSGGAFEFDLEGFLADIENVKKRLNVAVQVVTEAALKASDAIAKDIISQAQIRLESQTRSGDLSRSARILEPQLVGTTIVQGLGFTERYSAQRDQGGEILPKNGRALAIPLDPVLTPAGVARYDSPLRDDGAPNGLFVVKLWGKVFLAQHVGEGEGAYLDLRWLLVPSVNQKGSFFFTGVIDERKAQVGAIMGQLIKDDLGRAA